MQQTPQEAQAQAARQRFLAQHGIQAKDQHLVTHTLAQVQGVMVQRTDEACVHYLRKWVKELRALKPKSFHHWMRHHKAAFEAVDQKHDPITGKHSLTYCYVRENPRARKAFEITFCVTPILNGKGLFRLDVDHVEVPFPANVSVKLAE